MKNLQRSSLVEDWENNKKQKVIVHHLYVDFAERQIRLEESVRWCVYERGVRTLPLCLKGDPPGLRWSSLARLRLQTTSVIQIPHAKLHEWANLVVLDINLVIHKSFGISQLKCLRSLKLAGAEHEIRQCCCSSSEKRPTIYRLLCTMSDTLKALQFTCCNGKFPQILVLGTMPNLAVIKIVNDLGFSRHQERFDVVASMGVLTHLSRLALKNLPITGSLPGLENLVSPEDLQLSRCRMLNDLTALDKLANLQRLSMSGTAVAKLSGLESLASTWAVFRYLQSLEEFARFTIIAKSQRGFHCRTHQSIKPTSRASIVYTDIKVSE